MFFIGYANAVVQLTRSGQLTSQWQNQSNVRESTTKTALGSGLRIPRGSMNSGAGWALLHFRAQAVDHNVNPADHVADRLRYSDRYNKSTVFRHAQACDQKGVSLHRLSGAGPARRKPRSGRNGRFRGPRFVFAWETRLSLGSNTSTPVSPDLTTLITSATSSISFKTLQSFLHWVTPQEWNYPGR